MTRRGRNGAKHRDTEEWKGSGRFGSGGSEGWQEQAPGESPGGPGSHRGRSKLLTDGHGIHLRSKKVIGRPVANVRFHERGEGG